MLLGRTRELEQLGHALDADRPTVVAGESGVGKTALLRAAVARDGRPHFDGGALSTLSWLDYHALDRAIGRPVTGGDAAAVAAEVERAVAHGVLVLDDLQWATPPTLEVVSLIAGRVAVLVGLRTGKTSADLVLERLNAAGFDTVALPGLSRPDAVALVRQIRPELGPVAAGRLADRAGGNPLLVRELAASGEPSASMRLAIQARLRGLDPAAQQAFAVLALLGRPVAVDLLGRDAVNTLWDADLAVWSGTEQIEIRHALLGEVAVTDLDEDRRQQLHSIIANQIIDEPAEAARHHAHAGEQQAAYAKALAAADLSSRPGERASHLALAASCAHGPEAISLQLEAAYALEEAHDWPALSQVLDQLAAAPPRARAAAALLRARASWRAGDPESVRAAITEGLDLVRGNGDDIEVKLLIEQGRIPIFLDRDGKAAVRQTTSALELATRSGVEVPRALYLHGTALYIADDPAAPEFLMQAVDLARESDDLGTELLAANNLIAFHESGGNPAVARDLAEQYVERSRARGLAVWERSFRVALSNLDFHAGRYDAVLATADELLDLPLEVRARDSVIEQLCIALVDLGRIDEALRRIEAEPDRAEDWTWQRQVRWVRCEAALAGGQPRQARRYAEDLLNGPESDHNIDFARVSVAWASYDLDQKPTEYSSGSGDPAIAMLAAIPHEVDGVAHLQRGRADAAVEEFDRATELWSTYHQRGELRCRWAAGEAARRAGHTDAVERLLDAERHCGAAGMLPLTNRVQRSLRAVGVNRSAARRRTSSQLLTSRQREVLELVAAGLTNAEIAARLGVSRHTVVSQLSSASIKLGAGTRGQAAALAMSLDPE